MKYRHQHRNESGGSIISENIISMVSNNGSVSAKMKMAKRISIKAWQQQHRRARQRPHIIGINIAARSIAGIAAPREMRNENENDNGGEMA